MFQNCKKFIKHTSDIGTKKVLLLCCMRCFINSNSCFSLSDHDMIIISLISHFLKHGQIILMMIIRVVFHFKFISIKIDNCTENCNFFLFFTLKESFLQSFLTPTVIIRSQQCCKLLIINSAYSTITVREKTSSNSHRNNAAGRSS